VTKLGRCPAFVSMETSEGICALGPFADAPYSIGVQNIRDLPLRITADARHWRASKTANGMVRLAFPLFPLSGTRTVLIGERTACKIAGPSRPKPHRGRT